MRAAVLYAPGDIRVEDVPKPEPKSDEALIRVAAVGVCGSDIPRLLTKGAHKMPLICGHEFSGRIVALGDAVAGFAKDELVAIPPLIPCFECDQCRQGFFSRCRDYDYFGSRRDGAYAEYVRVPATNLLKVPSGSDATAVAMADPASIALHAIWKAPFAIGQRAAIVGAGPIGLFAIQWFRLMGAAEVMAVDLSEQKLELAREAGATHAALSDDPAVADFSADVVIEAAGHPASENLALSMAASGGHVVFIGIPTGDVTFSNKVCNHLLRQEISLHGAWNSFGAPFPGRQWTVTLEKLASGDLKWAFMISHDLGLDALPDMFQSFRARNAFYSKVMFRP